MARKKDFEACSGVMELLANGFTNDLKKIIQEVVAEVNSIDVGKADQKQDEKSGVAILQPDADRLIRVKEVLTLVPVARSTWLAGVKSGRYPAPVKNLGPRITAWRLSSILRLINGN